MRCRFLSSAAPALLAILLFSNCNIALACGSPGFLSASAHYVTGGQKNVLLHFSYSPDCRDFSNIMWGTPGGTWKQITYPHYGDDDWGYCIPYNRFCTLDMTKRVGAEIGKTYLFKVQSCRTRVLAPSVCGDWSDGGYTGWNRLQLKHSGQFLDAEYCTTKVGLGGRSDYNSGACQLWSLVPAENGWSRLRIKQGGKFLDAEYCGNKLGLNPASSFDGGACQLWRLVPAEGGWSRLQLKQGGQYLDAQFCGATIGLNPGSDYQGGACQLWRLVPDQ